MDKLKDKFDATRFQLESYEEWENTEPYEHFLAALAHLRRADITEEDEDYYNFERIREELESLGNRMGIKCEICESTGCGEYATTTDDSPARVPLCRWCYEMCCEETAMIEGNE